MLESIFREILNNPNATVKVFAIMAMQFSAGAVFGYLVPRAVKYFFPVLALTVLASCISIQLIPLSIDPGTLIGILLSAVPFLAGLATGSVVALLRK